MACQKQPSLFTPWVWSQLETLRFSYISVLNSDYQICHGLGLHLGCVILEQKMSWYVLLQGYVPVDNSTHHLTSTNCGFHMLVRHSAWNKELWGPMLLHMQGKTPKYMRDLCFHSKCSNCLQWYMELCIHHWFLAPMYASPCELQYSLTVYKIMLISNWPNKPLAPWAGGKEDCI